MTGGVAVVTGGGGTGAGLGRGLARELAGRGMAVAVLDLDLAAALAVAEEIRADGGQAMACGIDLENPSTLRAAASAVADAYGACNVLCAHAAAGVDVLVDDLWAPDVWQRAMTGIVVGTIATVHAFLPLLRATTGPRRVVLTSSSVALAPGRFQGPYRAAKAAVTSLGESLDLELAPEGIGVTISFPAGMMAVAADAEGASGAERAQQAAADALAGLDLPPSVLARLASIGEEMAADPTDITTGEAAARTIVDAALSGRRYVLTHGRSVEQQYRARHAELDLALEELASRSYVP
jgi:NAD(P)-dependent dehydrogenase (short-subunit alcohol dehydrogenase family)